MSPGFVAPLELPRAGDVIRLQEQTSDESFQLLCPVQIKEENVMTLSQISHINTSLERSCLESHLSRQVIGSASSPLHMVNIPRGLLPEVSVTELCS